MRFQIYDTYKMAAGANQSEMYVGFNNPAYLSARQKADRDYALAYFMRENGVRFSMYTLYKNILYIEKKC